MLSKILREDGVTELQSIKTVTFHETVNSDVDLRPGCVSSAYIEVVCYGDHSLAPDPGEELAYYTVDSEGNETLIGLFYARPAVSSRNTYTVVAYDSVYKLDADFSTWLAAHQSSFPYTISDLVNQSCTIAGVALDGTFSHSSLPVDAFYVEGLTCRQIISWAAEIAGCFVRANTSGEIYFGWYQTVSGYKIFPHSGTSPDSDVYVAYKQDGLQYEAYNVRKVSAVAIQPSGVEGAAYIYPTSVTQVYATDPNNDGNVILHNLVAVDDGDENITLSGDFDAYDTTGVGDIEIDDHDIDENPLIISGNVLLSGIASTNMVSIAQTIYNAMRSVPAYRPMNVSLFRDENPFRAGDIVSVEDIQGVSFYSPVMEFILSDSGADLISTGNETHKEYSTNVGDKLVQLASDIVKINKLKVDWAEIDTAVINVLQANGIDADWINTGALTILDAYGNIVFQADKDSHTAQIGNFVAYAPNGLESNRAITNGNTELEITHDVNGNFNISFMKTVNGLIEKYFEIKDEINISSLQSYDGFEISTSCGDIVFTPNGIYICQAGNWTTHFDGMDIEVQQPGWWRKSLGVDYKSGDSVTFGTSSYTQFSGGCRANNAFNFTIPLAKPVASGVTASVSGSIVIYGDGHYRTLSMDDVSIDSITVNIDGSGVTVHIVFDSNSVPSWYSAQNVFGIQAYNLTVSFI